MSNSFPLVVKTRLVGADMRAEDISAPAPPQVRTLDGGTWRRPFQAETNYYIRQPRSGAIMREFQNSECASWGAERLLTGTPTHLVDTTPPSEDDRYLYFQRWHFPADFESYGIWFPVYEANSDPELIIRLALFRTFPIENTSQAWSILPGAKFEFKGILDSDQIRRVLIPPDPPNRGKLIIPSGWYYLLIYPEPPFTAKAYTRIVRDYVEDDSIIWRSDRVTTIDVGGDWSTLDLATIVYENNGEAPPYDTLMWNDSYPRWPMVDFAFGGRFV